MVVAGVDEALVIEAEITAWLLRAESTLLVHMLPGGFSWDDAEAPLSPAVVARRGQGKAEYNTHGSIDLSRCLLYTSPSPRD